MKLRDALYNWLQMKVVSEERPEDEAALETLEFFETILSEDHRLTQFAIANTTDRNYVVSYELEGQSATETFDRELAEQLLQEISSNPKYNE